MAEFTEENQGGDTSGGETSEERSFGEVSSREETVGGNSSESEVKTEEAGAVEAESTTGKEATGEEKSETGEAQPKLTEKGTKLDPNPESAAHQLLANEKRIRSQMEEVLGNPEKLAAFMEKQYGIKANLPAKEGEVITPALKTYTAKDFETLDDVANVVNELQNSFAKAREQYEAKIAQLETGVTSLTQGGNAQRLYAKTSEEATSLRSEPELDPKSPDFIDGLETDIAEMYHKLDYDERTGTYKGEHSIKEIGDRVISAARKARKNGSLQAQTVVKNRSEGQVRTGPSARDTGTGESSDPAESIAKGIANLVK